MKPVNTLRKLIYEVRALIAEMTIGLAAELIMPKGDDKDELHKALDVYFLHIEEKLRK